MQPTQVVDHYDRTSESWYDAQEAHDLDATWSMYEVLPTDTHEWNGRTLHYSEHWGEKEVTATIDGPTYLDAFKACDKLIKLSGDGHHIFVESIEEVDGKLTLCTGS